MRPEILNPLFASVEGFKGVGARYAKLLGNLCGGLRVVDMLWHLPQGLIDRTYTVPLREAQAGRIWTGKIKILEHMEPPTRKQPYRVLAEDENGTELTLNFFKWYPDSLKRSLPKGEVRAVSGKLEIFNGRLQMNHPDYIVMPSMFENLHGVEPVYPLCAGITNKLMRRLVLQGLEKLPALPEWLDSRFQNQEKMPSFTKALQEAHHPKTQADLSLDSPARRRLAYDELLAGQLALAMAREHVKKQAGRVLAGDGHLRRAKARVKRDCGRYGHA